MVFVIVVVGVAVLVASVVHVDISLEVLIGSKSFRGRSRKDAKGFVDPFSDVIPNLKKTEATLALEHKARAGVDVVHDGLAIHRDNAVTTQRELVEGD